MQFCSHQKLQIKLGEEESSPSPALSRRRKTALRDAAASRQLALFGNRAEAAPQGRPSPERVTRASKNEAPSSRVSALPTLPSSSPRASASSLLLASSPLLKVTVRAPCCPQEQVKGLALALQELVAYPLHLIVHDNRSTMISFRRQRELMTLRVHHMFVGSDRQIVEALADYSRSRCKRAGEVLDGYVRASRDQIRKLGIEDSSRRNTEARGEHHDLALIYEVLNARYFNGSIDAHIGWGRGSSQRRRRSIRMGAYYHQDRSILIHPALDQRQVPRFFVEFVVYHEMLHQAVPQQRTASGRRLVHPPEFRRRERLFHAYQEAQEWEKENLKLLLNAKTSRGSSG